MAYGWTRMTTSFVYYATNFFTWWTGTLMTFVRFPLDMMADRWNFTRLVAWWWLDSLFCATWHHYFTTTTSALYDVRSCTRIARTTVTRCSTFMLAAVESAFTCFLTGIGYVS